MKIFLFLGARRGYAVLQKLLEVKADIAGILCLVEDPHEEQFHPRMAAMANERSIPLFFSSDVKPSDYQAVIEQLKPDLAFAIGWRYMINKEAYSLPPLGTLIIHDSLLPKYRGFAPMNWAIIKGEKETGVTLFHIADGVDCGPIVDQMSTPIDENDTAKTVDERIIKLYQEIMVKCLATFEAGEVKAVPQDEAQATYTCKRTPEDGEIDWNKSAVEIHNLIRGLTQPFPGAYTRLNGKKLTLWESELAGDNRIFAGSIAGRAIGKNQGMIEVLTGEGILRLKRLQYENEEEKQAKDFTVSVKDTFGR